MKWLVLAAELAAIWAALSVATAPPVGTAPPPRARQFRGPAMSAILAAAAVLAGAAIIVAVFATIRGDW